MKASSSFDIFLSLIGRRERYDIQGLRSVFGLVIRGGSIVLWCGRVQYIGNRKDVSLLVVAMDSFTSLPLSFKYHRTHQLSATGEEA